MNRNIGLTKSTVLSVILFVLVAMFIKGRPGEPAASALFGASTFLFGIFIAFSISNCYSRYSKINELLNCDEGILLFVYRASESFGEKVKTDIRRLLDVYLIDQIDYCLVDFRNSNGSFLKLFDYVLRLSPKSKKEEAAHDKMVDLLADSMKNRKLVETLVREPMHRFEWASILVLLVIVIFCIFILNDGSLFSMVSSVLLATSAMVFTLILEDLDSLRWKERYWIWEALDGLFRELDLVPYYPGDLVLSKRIVLQKGKKVRIATYPNQYPNMTGKSVETVETK